jgi:ADP-ribose pyrophosphatase
MSRSSGRAGEPLADLPAEVLLSPPKLIGRGFRDYERYDVTIPGDDGPIKLTRDVVRIGKVAMVLPIDLVRDEVVLIRQFRLPAHLANGRGQLIEIVAGHVEAGESIAEAARRECIEEIGVEPHPLIELSTYLSTPGLCDEEMTVFVGVVDAAKVPARAGAAAENEMTRPFAVSIDAALAALDRGAVHDGPLTIALQWLALHRARLHEIVRTGSVKI